MIDRDEALAELRTMLDYLARLTEQSDQCDFELASDLVDALGHVDRAVETATGMLTGQMLSRLEVDGGARDFGPYRFERVRKYTERTDHDAVIDAVVEQAMHSDGVAQAARHTAEMLRAIYLSKSVVARKGEIDKLEVPRHKAFSKEYTGWKVARSEIPQ